MIIHPSSAQNSGFQFIFRNLSIFVEILRKVFAGNSRILWKIRYIIRFLFGALTKESCYGTEFLTWDHVAGTGGIP